MHFKSLNRWNVENTLVHSTIERQIAKPHGAHDTKQNTKTVG